MFFFLERSYEIKKDYLILRLLYYTSLIHNKEDVLQRFFLDSEQC